MTPYFLGTWGSHSTRSPRTSSTFLRTAAASRFPTSRTSTISARGSMSRSPTSGKATPTGTSRYVTNKTSPRCHPEIFFFKASIVAWFKDREEQGDKENALVLALIFFDHVSCNLGVTLSFCFYSYLFFSTSTPTCAMSRSHWTMTGAPRTRAWPTPTGSATTPRSPRSGSRWEAEKTQNL